MRTVAVITGGGGGLGLAAAKIIGRDRYVVISDISQDRLDAARRDLKQIGIECETVRCDVTDRESVAGLVDSASTLGRVASVIHTAGISPSMGTAESIVRINALGTANITEGFRPVADEGFVIVNVASQAAYMLPAAFVPRRRFRYAAQNEDLFMAKMLSACNLAPRKLRADMAYCLSKSFVVWYCASQANSFGHRGARILSISPGPFDTEMGRLEERSVAAMIQHTALKRLGDPGEIAELAAFCASDKANYLTGVDILCDGGAIATMTLRDKLAATRNR